MRRPVSRIVLTLALSTSLAGCGVGFDPPSEVNTLRVLGVQKDDPYPEPGQSVTLSMLWHDGLADPLQPAETARDVQVTWFTGCTNPESESFYGCFAQLAGNDVMMTTGDTTSLRISPDVLQDLPPPREDQPLIGRSFAFFSLCAGTVALEAPREEGALPISCRDASGALLGPDSFVVGYTTLFTYAEPKADGTPIDNQNPIVTGFQIEGTPVDNYCTNANCLEFQPYEEPAIDCDSDSDQHLCFSVCKDDGDESCPEIRLRPEIDRASAEKDEAANTFFGRDYEEQMWINYYVDRGAVKGAGVRLLNDATTGWNDDYGTEFYAPADPGPVTVWAVVHDDRGGQSWVRTRIMITDAPAQ